MGCMKTFAILTSVSIIALSIYLYTPIPDGISEPWKVRTYLAFGKIIGLLGSVSEMTGYDSSLNITRMIMKLVLPSTPVSKSDPLLKVTDTTFDGIKVRIYRPKSAKMPSPALVYFHGGGWSFGNIDLVDGFTSEVAKLANIIVVSVEYRLAPEHPFPKPFEDCVTATLHLLQNYEQYGVHGDKIAVGGDSAGGNLAAATALLLNSNAQLPDILFQLLIYPPVQLMNFRLPSYLSPEKWPYLGQLEMAYYWANYIGPTTHPNCPQAMTENQHVSPVFKKSHYSDYVNVSLNLPTEFLGKVESADLDSGNETLWEEIQNTVLDPYVSPLLAHEIATVPKAIVVSAEYDVLLDEMILYAERMRKSGIEVKHRHYKMFHGFLTLVELFETSRNATREISNDIINHINQKEES